MCRAQKLGAAAFCRALATGWRSEVPIMSGSGSGSGDPAGSDAWPQFPDAPNFSDEGFRLSGNILGDFEELMDLTPNAAPAASFAAHGFGQSASAPAPNTADDASGSRDSSAVAASASAPRTAEERRQFRNRMSQRRFREKQKAGNIQLVNISNPAIHCHVLIDVCSCRRSRKR